MCRKRCYSSTIRRPVVLCLEVTVNKTRTGEQNRDSAASAEAWSENPFTAQIKFEGTFSVPPPVPTPGTFTITRLESTAGLHDRITRVSSVPALLVSISLKSLPLHSYQVWVADKLVPTRGSFLRFQSNVIDFDSEPSCWSGKAFDYVHYTRPRVELDGIASDFGFGLVTHQWMIRRRIEHAQELLRQTATPIVDIAMQSGFGDQVAFTRTFRQAVGVSPGRWRRYHSTRAIGPDNLA